MKPRHMTTTNTHMNTPEQKIAVTVRFLGPTNFRPARVALNLPRWKAKVVFDWHSAKGGDISKQALAWFEAHGITPDSYLVLPDCYVFAFPWGQLAKILKAFGVEGSK